jgi:hypothetical protein
MMMRKILFIALLTLVLSACRSSVQTQYIPVESVRIDSIYIRSVARDTLLQRDSIYVLERGDTLRIERWHTLYKTRLLTDTLYIERNDTVRQVVQVQKQLSKWQRTQITLGKIMIVLLFCALCAAVLWLIKRFRK